MRNVVIVVVLSHMAICVTTWVLAWHARDQEVLGLTVTLDRLQQGRDLSVNCTTPIADGACVGVIRFAHGTGEPHDCPPGKVAYAWTKWDCVVAPVWHTLDDDVPELERP